MRLKNLIAGGFGTGVGTIIWQSYSQGWAGVDWFKVGFITLFAICVAAPFSVLLTNPKQDRLR